MTPTTEHRPASRPPTLTAAPSPAPSLRAGSFIPPSLSAQGSAQNTSLNYAASHLPQADAAAFSAMMARAKIEIAAIEHDRLCEASADRFGYSGVVGLRDKRQKALHARMRAELDAGKVT